MNPRCIRAGGPTSRAPQIHGSPTPAWSLTATRSSCSSGEHRARLDSQGIRKPARRVRPAPSGSGPIAIFSNLGKPGQRLSFLRKPRRSLPTLEGRQRQGGSLAAPWTPGRRGPTREEKS
jgi:hypothetical protein